MKPKIFLVSFILLVVLIVISFFFSNEKPKTTPLPVSTPQQEPAQEETPTRDYSYLLPSTVSGDPAITIVKKTYSPKKMAPIPTAEESQRQAEVDAVLQSPAPANNPSNTDASATPVKHKYLSETQKKELQSRNIVMF